jgi:membrane protein implicated in regulation of membrane protease activity
VALTVAIILAFFAPWPWNLIAVLGGLGIEAVELVWGFRLARRWRPPPEAEAMIGQVAEVVAPCRPIGHVGQRLRIEGLEGLTLVVTPTDS